MSDPVNPYQTPQVISDRLDGGLGKVMQTKLYANLARLSLWVVSLSSLYIAIVTYQLIKYYGKNIGLMYGHYASSSGFNVVLVKEICVVSFFLSVLFVSIWKYRSMSNAWVFRKMKMLPTVSAGWSIGWYFIPMANLWKPYEAMTEIMIHTIGEFKYKLLFRLWWCVWIMGFISMVSILRGGMRINNFELNREVMFYICLALASFLLMRIVFIITKVQAAEIELIKEKEGKL